VRPSPPARRTLAVSWPSTVSYQRDEHTRVDDAQYSRD
jgi:hypothetical protein